MTSYKGLNGTGSKRATSKMSHPKGGPVEELQFTDEARQYLLHHVAHSRYHVRRLELLGSVPTWVCRLFPRAVRWYVQIRTRTARNAAIAEA